MFECIGYRFRTPRERTHEDAPGELYFTVVTGRGLWCVVSYTLEKRNDTTPITVLPTIHGVHMQRRAQPATLTPH